MPQHYLAPLLSPQSVAVIGASEREGSLGRFVMQNMLRQAYEGEIFPVNPQYDSVFGLACHAAVGELPRVPELVVIATPARTVPGLLRDAGEAGVRHAVVLSAGFDDDQPGSGTRNEEIRAALRDSGVRLIGPNSAGILRPGAGLAATFAPSPAKAGSLALVSQSGAVCTAIIDWAAAAGVGFSSIVSTGAALDVDFGELLDYFAHDAATHSILLYIEGIRDARGFLSALRLASRVKPVIVFKAGRHAAETHTVSGHTAALVGSDAVFDAALARAGAVRVDSSLQLFAAARVLATRRRTRGDRLAVITNGSGPGVVAADSAIASRVSLAALSPATNETLARLSPRPWRAENPVDIFGDADAARFESATRAVLTDDNVDGALVLFCPQAVTSAEGAAAAVIAGAADQSKPLLTAWLGGASLAAARALFEASETPNFLTPENAVDAFAYLARFQKHQSMLLESVTAYGSMSFHEATQAVARAKEIRDGALALGRGALTELESKALLAAFGLPVNEGRLVLNAEDAVAAAVELGYPVAMKIQSAAVTHKSDVGGVRLNLANARHVANAFDDMLEQLRATLPAAALDGVNVQKMLRFPAQRELLVGIKRDPLFGPVIAFGAGGVAVEVLRDVSLALPPLNPTLAAALVDETRIRGVLGAYRDVPGVDMPALLDILQRVSMMAALLPWIAEMDLNPVLAHPGGAAIVDARIVIDPAAPVTDLRYAHMAIVPYPAQLEREVRLKDGTLLLLRPIRPDDAGRERDFMAGLSEASRYSRFQHPIAALSPEMIARFTQLDYGREMALVAIDPRDDRIAGVSRYFPNPDRVSVEFALAVGDAWQGRGLGALLLSSLVECAREAGYERIEGSVLVDNAAMLALTSRLGFVRSPGDEPHQTVTVTRDLRER